LADVLGSYFFTQEPIVTIRPKSISFYFDEIIFSNRPRKELDTLCLDVIECGPESGLMNHGRYKKVEGKFMHKLVFAFLGVILLSTPLGAADRIRIGIPNIGAQFMTFPLAQAKGFLAEEKLEVEHIRIFGPVAMVALVSGELDYWGAIGFAVRSAIQGLPVRATAGFLPVHPSALIVRPDIKTVHDLRGETLGTSTFGGAPEVMARLILRHFGLDPDKDVKFLALGAAAENRFAAMRQD
jgi:ABC-type nitrate/sulfonate/bicarbonate transport system substrate-binding protein